MKNKLFQQRKEAKPIFFFLMFLLFGQSLWGQNIIYDAPLPQTENTIIRNYKTNVDIGCDVIGSEFVFSYNDRNSLIVRQFTMPIGIGISDFEILDDTLYLCGWRYDNGNTYAVYGWFSINHVFFGVDNIYLRYFSADSDHIFTFRFMEAKKIAGTIHVLMTGSANISDQNGPSKLSYNCSIIAEAWRTTSGIWNYKYAYDTTQKFEYVDIALTNNYAVVASSRYVDNRTYSHCIISYQLPTASTANNSVFDLAYNVGNNLILVLPQETDTAIFSWIHSDSYRITKMESDGFSTIMRAELSTLNNTIQVVNIYDHPLSSPICRFYFFNNIAQRYFGIGYNPICKTLYYVQDYPENHFYTTTYPYTSMKVNGTQEFTWFDIDNIEGTPYNILSGWGDRNYRKLWLFDENSDNCNWLDEVPVYNLPRDQVSIEHKQKITRVAPRIDSPIMTSVDGEISIICNP